MVDNNLEEPFIRDKEGLFDVTCQELIAMFDINSKLDIKVQQLKSHGDIEGLAKKLRVDLNKGLPKNEKDRVNRTQAFGDNARREKPPKTFCFFISEQLEDTILRILVVASLISLTLGLIMEPDHGWIEGTAILFAVVIVVFVGAGNDYAKELKFRQLYQQTEKQSITVKREGLADIIPVEELLVGDVVELKTGEKLPCDGILIEANGIVCDESNATGESKPLPKRQGAEAGHDPFLISESNVTEGTGKMIVTAVGKNSFSGRNQEMMEKAQEAQEGNSTPLQEKLEIVASTIGYIGLVAAILTVLVLYGRFFIGELYVKQAEWKSEYWLEIMQYLIIGITVIVVAIPEGLPLAVTLCLAFSVKQMEKEQNLVRHLNACETMGGADNICSDKTGTLTQNKMTVVQFYVQEYNYKYDQFNNLKSQIRGFFEIFNESICINSTGHVKWNQEKNAWDQFGNRTDCALIQMASQMGYNYLELRDKYKKLHVIPFSSEKKYMLTVIDRNGEHFVYAKGAAERVLEKCTQYISPDGNFYDLTQEEKEKIRQNVIKQYSIQALRSITLAYKRVESYQLPEDEQLSQNLIFMGIVGIQDPVRPGVPEAIETVTKKSGITVRMVTGDAIETAVAIAQECNIIGKCFTKNEVMLGSDFNSFVGGLVYVDDPKASSEGQNKEKKQIPTVKHLDKMKIVKENLKVLARSSPEDKFLLVTGLQQLGATVAVTGDGTNDAPALVKSDVGFAMFIAGTEVAKKACDIIMVNDDFRCIVTAVKWGRNIYDNIRKFVQFQLTVNVVALFMTFTGSAIFQEAPLTAVQMLWVNLIMDSLAALALATEPPSDKLLDRMPYKKDENIVTPAMWKNIIGLSVYESTILMLILIYGEEFFGVKSSMGMGVTWTQENGQLLTIFFNTFVFMQLFNEINCRKLLKSELNIFSGFCNNIYFITISVVTAIVQILIVQFGGYGLRTSPLTVEQHLYCICIGAGTLLWGFLVRIGPDAPFKCLKVKEDKTEEHQKSKTLYSSFRRQSTVWFNASPKVGPSPMNTFHKSK